MSAPVGGQLALRVLVTAASKHGATAEIAERIAAALRSALPAAEVDVQVPSKVTTLERYDAVVLGSAVYAGRWLDSARNLAVKHSAELARVPVWLFSSGPVGDPPKPDEDPVDAAPLVVATGARQHAVFAGKLERHHLRFAERVVATALRAPSGDFRDWAAIDAWASRIVQELQKV
ncbi:flavodoxin domain-containing protein [Phytohabitans houttuyneae]